MSWFRETVRTSQLGSLQMIIKGNTEKPDSHWLSELWDITTSIFYHSKVKLIKYFYKKTWLKVRFDGKNNLWSTGFQNPDQNN